MNKIRRRWLLILGLAFALMIAVAIHNFQWKAPAQFPNASITTGTEGALPSAALWQSNHELVCFFNAGSGYRQALLIDTIKNARVPLVKFNFQYQGRIPHDPFFVRMSPDGKWLLWADHTIGVHSGRPIWIAATLDGTRHRQWPRADTKFHHTFAWTRDSRHWVEIQDKTEEHYDGHILSAHTAHARALLYNLNAPAVVVLPVTLPMEVCDGVWCTPSDRVVVTDGSNTQFWDFGLTSIDPPRQFTVTLPPGTDVSGCALSPQGNQMVWMLSKLRPAQPRSMQYLRLLLHPASSYARSIWVSQLDGSQMHQVYPYVDVKDLWPPYPSWTPDGLRVGFWRQNTLWTVAAG